jgi:hypothetical protein
MLKKESILRLAEVRSRWCVSMYLPVTRAELQKNLNRLQHLCSEAEKRLLELDMSPLRVKRMLAPLDLFLRQTKF